MGWFSTQTACLAVVLSAVPGCRASSVAPSGASDTNPSDSTTEGDGVTTEEADDDDGGDENDDDDGDDGNGSDDDDNDDNDDDGDDDDDGGDGDGDNTSDGTDGDGGSDSGDGSDGDGIAPAFIPEPSQLAMGAGYFDLSTSTRIFFDTRDAPRATERSLEAVGAVLASELELLTGLAPTLVDLASGEVPQSGDIKLLFGDVDEVVALEDQEDQSYELSIADSTDVTSAYSKGVSYGTATLIQAIVEDQGKFRAPKLNITDSPANGYRTVMLDIARKPHGLEVLREAIRLARLYKIRYLQLHLTDDQNFVFPFAAVTDNLANNYIISHEDLRALVAYADAHGVTLIPELDLPGHSTRLRESGYLNPDENDRDVADPANYAKIQAIIDDMLVVFESSPYFHIGGDESQAGDRLEPFLEEMNRHLRGKPAAERRRMLVWEGFGGSPAGVPAQGEDRVIVLSWESSYNPPWSLLQNGYSVVNASWKPLYLVGRGSPRHPGVSTRMWSAQTIYGWNAETFMHWEPGRPVYEDAGPSDPDDNDGVWKASYIGKEAQVVGGQMLLWEQEDKLVTTDLRARVPAFAERLWSPDTGLDFEEFADKQAAVDPIVATIVNPVEVLPESVDPSSPASLDYAIYEGSSVAVRLNNRSRIDGVIRYNLGSFRDDLTWVYFDPIEAVTEASELYEGEFTGMGGFGIRAKLFRMDGTPVDGTTWHAFNNWEQVVRVTTYDIGREPLDTVPDMMALDPGQILSSHMLPMLRGPYTHVAIVGELLETVLEVPGSGSYQLSAKTQSGHATVYLDLDQDGAFDPNEAVIEDTPSTETPQNATVSLQQGSYGLRVDHAAALPRPVVLLTLDGPGTNGAVEISTLLAAPSRQ